MIVLCHSPKPGGGATTLAATVAAGLVERGVPRHRMVLVDLGAGATLTQWAQTAPRSGADLPPVVRPSRGLDLAALVEGFSHVVVDAAWDGRVRDALRPLRPDLVLVPCRPVGPDTWSLGRLTDGAGRSQRGGMAGAPLRVVPWRVPPRTDLRPWRRGIEEHGLAAAPVVARDRVAYAHALAAGRLPTEAGDVAVRAEAASLGGYVLGWAQVDAAGRPTEDALPARLLH